MRRNACLKGLAATCLLALPMVFGCESDRSTRVEGEEVGFWIDASDTDIVQGELVTLTAHDQNNKCSSKNNLDRHR